MLSRQTNGGMDNYAIRCADVQALSFENLSDVCLSWHSFGHLLLAVLLNASGRLLKFIEDFQ